MKWFFNMKISAKLISSFILVAFIAGIVGVIGIVNIRTIDNNAEDLYTNMTIPISQTAHMAKIFQKACVNMRDMILFDDPDEINAKYQEIKDLVAEMNENSDGFEATIASTEMQEAFDSFLAARVEFAKHLDYLLELSLENKDKEVFAYMNNEMSTSIYNEQAAIDKLVELKVEEAKIKSETNTIMANTAIITMIAVIASGMLLAVLLGLFISRVVSKPVKKLSKAAELIADGDLNIDLDIDTRDEIGALASSFRKMTDNLNDVMSNINSASEQVASGSKQVSESSIALSQGATEQASSVEELSSSLEEISVQTKQNAENANQANQLAETAKENASTGNAQMKDMLKAMDEINESSNNISKIIKVIDDIAFQTNILALNAAVEAARAGQHGKGFAVVAEEVRNLAARSAKAAKETTAMIEGSIKKVDGGTKIANQTAEALSKIVGNIAKVATLVGDIANASNEQAAGISQVNQGIIQVSSVVQTNSATSEESAAASEELSSQAEMLKDQVSRFKLRRMGNGQISYREMENVNPEILRMLDQMNKTKRTSQSSAEQSLVSQEIATKNVNKIKLSDYEFGKY